MSKPAIGQPDRSDTTPRDATALIKRHFVVLVYPFRHRISSKRRRARLRRLGGRWRPWIARVENDETKWTLGDTYFFLPHVRKLMYPELEVVSALDPVLQRDELRRLARQSPETFAEHLHPDGILRLTYNPTRLAELQPAWLTGRYAGADGGTEQVFPVHLEWIDAALFPQRIGFLVLKVTLDEEPSVDRFIEFLRSIQSLSPYVTGTVLSRWEFAGASGGSCSVRDLADYLLQGLAEGDDGLDADLPAFLARLRSGGAAARYTSSEAANVYGRTFRLYSYVCLDDTPRTSGSAADGECAAGAEAAGVGPVFATPTERLLYELATCTRTTDPDFMPHRLNLAHIMASARIALWENWEGMVLQDNTVFVGLRPSGFLLSAFAHNVEVDYFCLYLLPFYQKMRLSLMAEELVRRGDALYRNLWQARRLSEAFARFRNHYWVAEVSSRPQGMDLYRRYQQGLGVDALYASVSAEVLAMRTYYEARSSHLIGTFLMLFTVLNITGFVVDHFAQLVRWPGWESLLHAVRLMR